MGICLPFAAKSKKEVKDSVQFGFLSNLFPSSIQRNSLMSSSKLQYIKQTLLPPIKAKARPSTIRGKGTILLLFKVLRVLTLIEKC